MSSRPLSAHPVRPAPSRAAESGFTLVELLIVIVVIMILSGVAFIAFHAARSGTSARDTIAAATAYEQAITRFQTDHANTNPRASDMAVGGGPPPVDLGPRDLQGKPYMRAAPDGVQSGRVGVSMSCATPPASGNVTGFIAFCAGTDPAYQVRVSTRDGSGSPWTTCVMGRDPAAAPRC